MNKKLAYIIIIITSTWQVIRVLNNLEHSFQYVSLVPIDLDFENQFRDSVCPNLSEDNMSNNNQDISSMISGNDDSHINMVIHDNNERKKSWPKDNNNFMALAEALDHMDMIIYTVLETLQAKVRVTKYIWNKKILTGQIGGHYFHTWCLYVWSQEYATTVYRGVL